jgi:hypothetical protein
VVKGGSNLNDALEECFVRLGRPQPGLFPSFVSFEKAPGVELFDATEKRVMILGRGIWWVDGRSVSQRDLLRRMPLATGGLLGEASVASSGDSEAS